jgi:hypothetical protein
MPDSILSGWRNKIKRAHFFNRILGIPDRRVLGLELTKLPLRQGCGTSKSRRLFGRRAGPVTISGVFRSFIDYHVAEKMKRALQMKRPSEIVGRRTVARKESPVFP